MDKFLSEYKDLEKVLRDKENSLSIFDYEKSLTDSEEIEKIKVCRIIRNYVQHNKDGNKFLAATKEMTAFIEGLKNRELAKEQQIRDITKTVPALELKDNILVFFEKRKNLDWVPIIDTAAKKQVVGILDIDKIAQLLKTKENSKKKIKDLLTENYLTSSLKNVNIQERSDYVRDVDLEKRTIVLNNGKFSGVVEFE